MKLPPLFLLGLFTISAACLSPLHARLGESRSELERRLLQGSDRAMEVTDGSLEEFYQSRAPVRESLRILEENGLEYTVYYKSGDDVGAASSDLWLRDRSGRRSDRPDPKPDGWLLHVAYLNGVSVLEYYSRSEPLTEIESAGILLRNVGESRWVKGKVPTDDENVIVPRVFPANHYREDFAIYADIQDDSVLLFDPRLDVRVFELNLEKAKEEAPQSLEGF